MTRGLLIVLAACSAAAAPTPHAAPPPAVAASDAGVADVAAELACDGQPPTTAPLVASVWHPHGCDGKCPVYSVAVFRDGTIEYVGRAHVAVAGRRVTHVDAAVVEELEREFAAIGFASLPDYNSPRAFGGPTTIVQVGTASVQLAFGDLRIPPELTALVDKIDALAGAEQGSESARGEPCSTPATVVHGHILQKSVDGGVVRMVVGVGAKHGITPAWKAQLFTPDRRQLLPGGELTITEIRDRVLVVTMAGTAVPASTLVRFWLP
jgi:hypothetical protein